jgi:hypothetical protein
VTIELREDATAREQLVHAVQGPEEGYEAPVALKNDLGAQPLDERQVTGEVDGVPEALLRIYEDSPASDRLATPPWPR